MATYNDKQNKDKLAMMEAMIAKNPPPEPFVLQVAQESDNGVTLYKPIHVRFVFKSQFDTNPDSWTIYGDHDPETGVTKRYWDFEGVDGVEKLEKDTEAIVQLMCRVEKGKEKWEGVSIDFDTDKVKSKGYGGADATIGISNKVKDVAKKIGREVAQEYIDEQEKPHGSIGPDDQVPAVFLMPREYFELKDKLQRESIEKQVALKAFTDFCISTHATDADRDALRLAIYSYPLWLDEGIQATKKALGIEDEEEDNKEG